MIFDSSKILYADLILPLALQQLYTYRVPDEFSQNISRGMRVVVPFGKSKMYTAIVYTIHGNKPEHYDAKEILEMPDNFRVISESQFKFWEWMAEYYLCSLGEILIAALPSVMKLQSETAVELSDQYEADSILLTETENVIINYLNEKKLLTITDASKITGQKNALRLIRNLVERNILVIREEIKEAFQPRQISFVRMTKLAEDDAYMQDIFEKLEKRAPKQLELLMGFIKLKMDRGKDFISKSLLLKSTHSSPGTLKQLVDKNVFEIFEGEEMLAHLPVVETGRKVILSEMQQLAYNNVVSNFQLQKVTLLHGVTSSGKTEVYIRLISDMIEQGKQVLYLLPEIALTTQIISRLKSHFGDRLLVYHSRFSNRERAEVYMKIVNDGEKGVFRFPIIVGARSSVFLPLSKPGLIIVDEEHDSSYKQHDPAPRYNARDSAVVCGSIYHCNVLLGSATPSLESYYNAESGKYALVNLTERFGGLRMPEIKVVDLKDAYKKQRMKSHFSKDLLEGMKLALDAKQQVILFQNRRGFAPILECKNCGWIPHCINCDVSLTYHKRSNHLRCHYCGYSTFPAAKCNACGDPDVRMKGMGTERIEDEIAIFFPDHIIQRLDLDTSSSKSAYQRILSGFESGEIDILVGTQMVTKGLDFDHVSLVGVINADSLMNFPDFRSVERSYQLLAQVAGRSGRKFKRGEVLVQTFQVNHPLLSYLIHNDYVGFYRYELNERNKYLYPPFYRLIQFRLKHRDEKMLEELAKDFNRELKTVFGKRVLGPVAPPVSRVRNFYLRNIMLKIEKGIPNHEIKQKLTQVTNRFLSHLENRSIIIQVDVDPM